MAVLEHEEVLRILEQTFLIDVAVMVVGEALSNGLDQPADNLLQGINLTESQKFDMVYLCI
jgi:hypothetical protein